MTAIKCLTEGITKSEDLQPDGLASDLVYARGITYIEMQKFDEGIKDLSFSNDSILVML